MSQWRPVRRIRDFSPSNSSKAEGAAPGAEREWSDRRTALSRLLHSDAEVWRGAIWLSMIFNIC